ncbi:hypothetical protein L227DRAFT_413151 [Lentinus tigrinus ALCF2SS1-6]|uniref:Uncharacterized protein n=1 Tax=Lentinus tigrinus ALCF2SS1-6 TaxID=1328759 RepID=A0A5C2SH64_9APHY|nr:hypothetical protein L227DRAFT_413151 [Lentinus tigrinus ALCF2SS1-6]
MLAKEEAQVADPNRVRRNPIRPVSLAEAIRGLVLAYIYPPPLPFPHTAIFSTCLLRPALLRRPRRPRPQARLRSQTRTEGGSQARTLREPQGLVRSSSNPRLRLVNPQSLRCAPHPPFQTSLACYAVSRTQCALRGSVADIGHHAGASLVTLGSLLARQGNRTRRRSVVSCRGYPRLEVVARYAETPLRSSASPADVVDAMSGRDWRCVPGVGSSVRASMVVPGAGLYVALGTSNCLWRGS